VSKIVNFPNGAVVIQRDHATCVDLRGDAGREFIVDCARSSEGLLSDGELQNKYGLDEAILQQLVESKTVTRAIRTERARRKQTGDAAREAATPQAA